MGHIWDKPKINFLHEYRELMRGVTPIERKASLQEFVIGAMSISLDNIDKTDIISLLRAEILSTDQAYERAAAQNERWK